MTSHIISQSTEQKEMAMKTMRNGFEESIKETLSKNCPPDLIDSMVKEIFNQVDKKIETFHSNQDDKQKINHPTSYNGI